MTPYEWWAQMCAEYEDAEEAHWQAADMTPGHSGTPSSEDLDAWERARDRVDVIRAEMDDFIRRQFPQR